MNTFALQTCGVCRAPKPKSFLVCHACWMEVPFNLKARFWGLRGFHHHNPQRFENDFTRIRVTIISHLKQHGSALT